MRSVRLLVLALVMLLPWGRALPGAAQDATPGVATPLVATPHPFAGDARWLAYQTDRGGEGIWLIHPDGTDDHQIATDAPGQQLLPDWSPDGTRIAFTTLGGEHDPLYEYDLTTQTSHQLFACEDSCLSDDEPTYSPDGTKVAFIRALTPFVESEVFGGEVPSDCSLWIGDLASGEVQQITSHTDPACDREYSPRWSPDGKQLVYWRDPYAAGKPTGTAVYVINADGTEERQLTDPAMNAGYPEFSPDGAWILFDTYPLLEYQCCQVSNLYRMRPDGSGLEQLTFYETDELRATQPRYTPDGQWIVFTSVTPSTRSLWAIPADGGEPIVLAPGGIYTHGTWQPTTTEMGTPSA